MATIPTKISARSGWASDVVAHFLAEPAGPRKDAEMTHRRSHSDAEHGEAGAPTEQKADTAVRWWVSVVLVGSLIGLMPGALGVTGGWLIFGPPVLIVVLLFASAPGSYLAANRLGGQRWLALLSIPVLVSYPLVSSWLASSDRPALQVIVPGLTLFVAATLLLWPALRQVGAESDLGSVALGVSLIGSGVAGIGFGVAALRSSWNYLDGVTILLAGAALAGMGLAAMAPGIRWFGIATVCLGIVLTPGAVGWVTKGDRGGGYGLLVWCGLTVLYGFSTILDRDSLYRWATWLIGAATLVYGVAYILNGQNLFGVGILIASPSVVLTGMGVLRRGRRILGLGMMGMGAAGEFVGSSALPDARAVGVGALCYGLAAFGAGAFVLADEWRALFDWLTRNNN